MVQSPMLTLGVRKPVNHLPIFKAKDLFSCSVGLRPLGIGLGSQALTMNSLPKTTDPGRLGKESWGIYFCSKQCPLQVNPQHENTQAKVS